MTRRLHAALLTSLALRTLLGVVGGASGFAAERLAGTTAFEPPVELGDAPDHRYGEHAVTRLADWDGDGNVDLLIGAGDGRIWLRRQTDRLKFAPPEPVTAAGKPLRLGEGPTTACFADMNGDGRPDLVVAHSDTHVVWLENEGDGKGGEKGPRFASPRPFPGPEGKPLSLPKGCGGRIDVGDADSDGKLDLVAGAFTGPIVLYRHNGSRKKPGFDAGVALTCAGQEKSFAYNVHPTLFDVNQDGRCDAAYGMNWGTLGFLIAGDVKLKPRPKKKTAPAAPVFVSEVSPSFSSGGPVDLREIAGDDATPAFADLDGDGTLDCVTGGRKGKIFFLRGVSLSRQLERIASLMADHRDDLGAALKSDEALRKELLGLHQGVYRLCESFAVTPESRRELRDWYLAHVAEYSQWLKQGHHDQQQAPYVPSLAQQVWTILMRLHDGDPDARGHRRRVAKAIGFSGRLETILVEHGTLIIENGRATPNQLETLQSYLSLIPAELLGDRSVGAVTEVITIGEYLDPRMDVLHAGGINIFAAQSGAQGQSENPFPPDFRPCENDYFGVVLAHELNHRVDFTRFQKVPKYDQKYWRHMQKCCGQAVKFATPHGIGVDWEGTRKHFAAAGLWNGKEPDWLKAWADYWLTGPGKSRTLNVCRNHVTYFEPRYGIPFFLETRQESIASLANQYFTDSAHMLKFALDRHERGSSGCLDEWLLMADVYSLDTDQTFLYRHANGSVLLERSSAPLKRDPAGNITEITVEEVAYTFELDADGLVEKVERKR